jgi:hypothetical protein
MVVAAELAISLLPKVGAAGMPTGIQIAVMTPGTQATDDLAGALAGARRGA